MKVIQKFLNQLWCFLSVKVGVFGFYSEGAYPTTYHPPPHTSQGLEWCEPSELGGGLVITNNLGA